MSNLYAAWIGFSAGCIAGIISGLFFHKKDWLGGYNSWTRRMIRLGHISFFGIAILNLAFVLTCDLLQIKIIPVETSILLIVGAITMPLVCYLSAWKQSFRLFFCIPALSVTVGVVLFTWRILF